MRDVTLDSLRAQIGIVLQESTLFEGTIRENLAFGRPDASMEEVIEAAKAAEAHDFITSFPEGYETRVGERGVTLSGGQKQRIAIARALLLDPRILILDDATSSVDLATEYRIQKALERLMAGRTSFVIAQRVATVLNADQILVLDSGQIAACGTHEELLATSEIYAEIYSSQLQEDHALAPDAADFRTGRSQEVPHDATDRWVRSRPPRDTRRVLRRLLPYLAPYRKRLLLVGLLLVIGTAAELAGPYLIGVAVDQFIDPSGAPMPGWLRRLGGGAMSRTAGLSIDHRAAGPGLPAHAGP